MEGESSIWEEVWSMEQDEYYNDKPGEIHASSLGWCSKGLWYAMAGVERLEDDDLDRRHAMLIGSLIHDGFEIRIVRWAKEKGYKVWRERKVPMYQVYKNIKIKGKCDVLIEYPDGVREIIDIKTIERTFPGMDLKEHHALQLGFYMQQLQAEKGRIIYITRGRVSPNEIDRYRSKNRDWKMVMEMPITWKWIKPRLKTELDRIRGIAEMYHEGLEVKADNEEWWMCHYCGYRHICPERQGGDRDGP